MQVVSLKTFVLEGNDRIVLCLDHSLQNSGVRRQVSVAQGPTGTSGIRSLIPLKEDSSQPPRFLSFFLSSKKTEEKRFAHLVVTNGDMKCEAAPDKFILLSVNLSLPAMELGTATITAFYLRVNQRHLLPASIWRGGGAGSFRAS